MLKKVLHIGIRVKDLEESIKFYESLGFEIMNRYKKPDPKALVATVNKGETAFELWQFEDTSHPRVEVIKNHIAFLSDNLESDVKDMVKQGYILVTPPTTGVTLRYAFVQDKAGNYIELCEPLKN